MQLIRPAILLLAAVLAPPAAAATLEEQAASAAVLEEEAVDSSTQVQLSPQAAADPAAPATQIVAATQVGGTNTTVAWRTTGGGTWSQLSGFTPGGMVSRGAPDVTWGAGDDVWLAHLANNSGDGPCSIGSGVVLARSANDGATFSSTSLVALNEPGDPGYTFEDARVVLDRDSGGNVGSPVVVGGVTNYADANCAAPTGGHSVGITGPSTSANGIVIFVAAARWPSVVSLPDHRIVIAYYSETFNQIVVRRFKIGGAPGLWDPEGSAAIMPGTPATSAGGVSIPAAPDIALGPNGRLHLTYTVTNGSDADVVYAYSDNGGAAWSAPVSVADPAAASANQFLPAITGGSTTGTTIPGGRAEIAYLDDRDPGPGYRPYLTAFAQFSGDATPTRGGNRPLDASTHAVAAAGVGTRLGILVTSADASAPSGPAFTWWPNTNVAGDPVKLYRSRVNHGAEAPVLPNGTIGTSKNVAVDVPDLYAATDGDGDPVRVSIIAPPAHGTIQGTTFTPTPGYAGADVMTLLADDGQPRGGTQRQIVIGNSAPMITSVTSPLMVPQGGSASLQLSATDADPGDQALLRYELVDPLPTQLKDSVTVTDGGLLTVRASKTARSTSILDVRVRVIDSSPLVGGTREMLVPVKIDPRYVPFAVAASFVPTGSTAKFTAEVDDNDQERGTSVRTYDWNWGDGATHGDEAQQKHTYKPGRYTWTVTVSIRRLEKTVSLSASGSIEVTEAGIKVLRLKQSRPNKKKKTVTFKLRPQINGDVDIYLKAGRYRVKPVKRTLVAHRDLNVTLPTRALNNARSASLVVRFRAVPAGPSPTPVIFSIRLR